MEQGNFASLNASSSAPQGFCFGTFRGVSGGIYLSRASSSRLGISSRSVPIFFTEGNRESGNNEGAGSGSPLM